MSESVRRVQTEPEVIVGLETISREWRKSDSHLFRQTHLAARMRLQSSDIAFLINLIIIRGNYFIGRNFHLIILRSKPQQSKQYVKLSDRICEPTEILMGQPCPIITSCSVFVTAKKGRKEGCGGDRVTFVEVILRNQEAFFAGRRGLSSGEVKEAVRHRD